MSGQTLERAREAERSATSELAQIPAWIWDGESLPVPVETIADSHYGLLVREHHDLCGLAGLPPEGKVSGLLVAASREIWIDSGEAQRAPTRRRFTVGHELGHWVLHCERGEGLADEHVHCRDVTVSEQGVVERSKGTNHLADFALYPPQELDANQFGAALLMPADVLRTRRERLGDDPVALAAAFNVSSIAMERRLWFLDQAGAG